MFIDEIFNGEQYLKWGNEIVPGNNIHLGKILNWFFSTAHYYLSVPTVDIVDWSYRGVSSFTKHKNIELLGFCKEQSLWNNTKNLEELRQKYGECISLVKPLDVI